jgi:hypothetical protein
MATEDIDIFDQDHMTVDAYDPEGNLTERKIIFSASQEGDPLVSDARKRSDRNMQIMEAARELGLTTNRAGKMGAGKMGAYPPEIRRQLDLSALKGVVSDRDMEEKYLPDPSAFVREKEKIKELIRKMDELILQRQRGLISDKEFKLYAYQLHQGTPYEEEYNFFNKGGSVEDFDIFDYLPSEAQVAYFGSQFAPGMGFLDASGNLSAMPDSDVDLIDAFSAEDMSSIGENISRGELFDAAMQGLGVLGDSMYMVPVAGAVTGPTLGSVAKGLGIAGKAAKSGIESLDFSIADLKNIFIDEHPPVGSIDPKKGSPVTERDIKTRANAYEKNLKKPAFKRREEARVVGTATDLPNIQERVILDPNELSGYSLVPVAGDRSGIGTLREVNGVPLSIPVPVQSGPHYPQFMQSLRGNQQLTFGPGNTDGPYGWASMQSAADKKQGNFRLALEQTGMPPLGVTTAMGRESADFSTPMSVAAVAQMDFLKPAKKDILTFNKAVRTGTKGRVAIPDFVGIESPDAVDQLLGNIPSFKADGRRTSAGVVRLSFLDVLKMPGTQSAGFANYEDLVRAVTIPELRLPQPIKGAGQYNPAESGYTIFKARPELSTFKDPYHLSYDTAIPGEYMGGLTGRGVPPEIIFPTTMQKMAKRGLPREQQTGSLMMDPKLVEPVTDKLIEDLAQYLNRVHGTKYAQGGIVSLTGVAA